MLPIKYSYDHDTYVIKNRIEPDTKLDSKSWILRLLSVTLLDHDSYSPKDLEFSQVICHAANKIYDRDSYWHQNQELKAFICHAAYKILIWLWHLLTIKSEIYCHNCHGGHVFLGKSTKKWCFFVNCHGRDS